MTRKILIGRRRSDLSLEPELWQALEEIADMERMTSDDLLKKIVDESRFSAGLDSIVRLYLLDYFRNLAGLSPASLGEPPARHPAH